MKEFKKVGFSSAVPGTGHGLDGRLAYMNDKYFVLVEEGTTPLGIGFSHLSIRRLDRKCIHDWRELQEIKNLICSPIREAIEIYPAQDRVVDTANQFHLWVMGEGIKIPFGWENGEITDAHEAHQNVVQRPLGQEAGE